MVGARARRSPTPKGVACRAAWRASYSRSPGRQSAIRRDCCPATRQSRPRCGPSPVLTPFLRSLVERGLDVSQGVLVILDGGNGLRSAVRKAFRDRSMVHRCQRHIAGRDPRFQRGVRSPPGQIPMRPVA